MSGFGSDPFSLDEDIGGEAPSSPPRRRPEPATPPPPAPPGPIVTTFKPENPKPSPKGKRGRPRLENPKKQITLRLDADIVEHFRKTGRGWQTRINEALREATGLAENGK